MTAKLSLTALARSMKRATDSYWRQRFHGRDVCRIRHRQGRDAMFVLATQVQGDAAGDQHVEVPAGVQE